MSEASESVGANSSVWTESSPLTADGSNVGRKRRMIGRTCARALAGLVVVAALSGSVIVYLIPQEERRIVLEGLLGIDVVGRLLGVTQESKMGVIN